MKDNEKGIRILTMSRDIHHMCKDIKSYHRGDKKLMQIHDDLRKIDARLYNYSLRLIEGLNVKTKEREE